VATVGVSVGVDVDNVGATVGSAVVGEEVGTIDQILRLEMVASAITYGVSK